MSKTLSPNITWQLNSKMLLTILGDIHVVSFKQSHAVFYEYYGLSCK